MKKYCKPMVVVENYVLTQSIASCITKIGFMDSACVLNDEDATPRMKDFAQIGFFITDCDKSAVGMDSNDKICYHTNANAAFSS